MQAAQSRVGKVLSNCAMWPPIEGSRSTRYTGSPASASSRAAWIPAIPPPTTSVAGFTFTAIGSSGFWWATRRTAPERVARALSVAGPFSSEHHETCSRMFAIWKR